MRRLLIIALIFCACACNGQALRFSQPMYDDTVLPDASTTVMMHFENDFTDIGGSTWGAVSGSNLWGFSTDKKFGSYSMDGSGSSGSRIQCVATAPFSFSTGDYTIEFFQKIAPIYFSTTFQPLAMTFSLNSGASSAVLSFSHTYSPSPTPYRLQMQYSTSSGESAIWGSSVDSSGWHHICFERRSGTLYGYLDGVEKLSCSSTYDFSGLTSITINQPSYNSSQQSVHVFLDELRVKKGGYVYGGAFTPPTRAIGVEKPMQIKFSEPMIDTTQLPDASTSVLLHFEDNLNDLGGLSWQNGTAYPSDTPFYFDPNGKIATCAKTLMNIADTVVTQATTYPANEFDFGTGDYTVEYWAKMKITSLLNKVSGSVTASNLIIFKSFSPNKNVQFGLRFNVYCDLPGPGYTCTSTPILRYYDTDVGATEATLSDEDGYNPAWYHVCFERRAGVVYGYVNGKLKLTKASAYSASPGLMARLQSTDGPFNGNCYIDDFRVFKGGYVYGGEFTPPVRGIGKIYPARIKISEVAP